MMNSLKTEVCVLGSGSQGNAVYIRNGRTRLLIDAGLTPAQIQQRLQGLGVSLQEINAVVISHEHGDHIQAAKKLCKTFGIPIWLTEKTRRVCKSFDSLVNIQEFQAGEGFSIDEIHLDPIPLSHDAVDPVCFGIMTERVKIGVATDFGKVEKPIIRGLSFCDLLILEFNHDVQLVHHGPYLPHLKDRILSERGHLSNEDSSDLLFELLNPNLKGVILAHLSHTNNYPELAYLSAKKVTSFPPYENLPLYLAHQEFAGPKLVF
ncbi:MAG TPA: MBL fold metallo-hydrolase [Nitrospiria bacterium]